jgi:hypothetical protein
MSTSDRTFNQVKAILGKLDQSIDQARERRTHPTAPVAASPSHLPAARPLGTGENGATAPPSRPGIGRATPLPLELTPGSAVALNGAGASPRRFGQ